MSLEDCIQRGVDGGEMDMERGQQAQALFQRLRQGYRARVGEDAANAQAAEDVKRIMAGRIGEKRRQAFLRMSIARRNVQLINRHRTLKGAEDPADALRIFITGDENSEIVGIDPLAKTLRGFYHGEFDRVLKTFGRNIIGQTRNKARLKNFVDELFGKNTGDVSAKELADAARHVQDLARKDFNAAGGNIAEIENYGLPMRHNAGAIEGVGRAAWKDAIWNRLDWHRMKDFETDQPFALEGSAPPRGGRAELVLDEVYASIVSNGWARREPSFMERGLALANSRQAHRVLHFKDGENWLAYNQEFGADDPFTTLVSTIDGYARDTAQLRVLGPNPAAGLEFLNQTVMKMAETRPWRDGAVNQTRAAARKARVMLDLHSGAAQDPANGWWGEVLAGTRGVLVSAQLGSAAVSAVTDVGFQAAAARKVGMDPGGLIKRMAQELVGDETRAIRFGLIADTLSSVGAGQARFVGEAFTPEAVARLSDFVMRASGLSRWTQSGRFAFQMEFMGLLADQSTVPWDDMIPAFRRTLERKGLTANDWDVIRQTELHNDGGATFLIPRDIRYREDIPTDQAEDLAFRLMSVIHEQTEFAVPSASLEGQAMFTDMTRPGTLIGELARSGLMYKSFGMSVLFSQTRRLFSHQTLTGRLGYFTSMSALMAVMGAVSLQMKEVIKGRDPRPMNSASFVGAAILQGGGFGIFGDFLAAEQNRFGGGIEATLAGPVFGAAGEVVGLGIEASREVAELAGMDVSANFGRRATNFLRYNTPVTGIWYWSSAFQRGVFDNLQRLVDPGAERAWRRAERRRMNSFGNQSWWGAGDILPERAPDFGAAIP